MTDHDVDQPVRASALRPRALRNRAIVIAVAVGGLLIAAGAAWFAFAAPAEPSVPTLRLESRPYLRQVTAEGNLKATRATRVNTPDDGPRGPMKIAMILEDGSPVKAGQVIVEFDSTDFERDLLDGREAMSKASNQISGTEADAGAIRTNLKRDATLAESELRSAREFQMTDAEIFSRYQVIESAIDEDLAVEKKEYAEQMQFVRDQLFRADREILGIDERKANLRIDRAQRGLSALQVPAPHDGIIVLNRDWRGEIPRVGSTVWSGFPIGEIPELSSMQVEAFVLEADAGGIAEGQEATVVVEAHPGREFSGKVLKVEPMAKPRFRGSPVQYFGVTLSLDETDVSVMKPGARVRATITLEKSASAIAVPRQAIFDRDGKRIVYRLNDGKFEPVEVELGSASVGAIVVKKGLEPGDEIALRDPERAASASSRKEDS